MFFKNFSSTVQRIENKENNPKNDVELVETCWNSKKKFHKFHTLKTNEI